MSKKIVLLADVFHPYNTSASVQLVDLSKEFVKHGHEIWVVTPVDNQKERWTHDVWHEVNVLRLKAPKIKNVNFVRRFFAELALPFFMIRNLQKSPIEMGKLNGVLWYSPTIFFGLVAKYLKRKSKSKGYLIIRDIFPDWAVSLGIMKKGPVYYFLKWVEHFQYRVADYIGVETPSNLSYFNQWELEGIRSVEVLENWMAKMPDVGCSIDISKTRLRDKKIFVYAGTLGVAQNVYKIVDLAEELRSNSELGFVVVGQGSESARLKEKVTQKKLDNLLFFDAIPSEEIFGLYKQCDVGLLTLDHRHKTFNVPGKFVSYMQAGLPILASINPGNDLVKIIQDSDVGRVSIENGIAELSLMAQNLVEVLNNDSKMTERCIAIADKHYKPEVAVAKILKHLQ